MVFLALLVLLAAAVWLQNLLFSRLSFQKLSYRCAFSTAEAVEGDEIELIETVENNGWLPAPWLKAEITTSRWLDYAGSQSVVTDQTRFVPSFFMIRGHQRIERRWKVRCLKRGVFPVERIVLVTTDLLGNLSLSKPVSSDAAVQVLPLPLKLPAAVCPPRFLWGERVVRRHLYTDPFFCSGVREYTGREALRRVHWPATAKMGKLMTLEEDSTSRENLVVLLNVQSRPFENGPVVDTGKIETGIRACAALFEGTLEDETPVRFFCNAGIRPGREPVRTPEGFGEDYIHSLMQLLSLLHLHNTDDIGVFLGEVSRSLSCARLVLVTSFINEDIARFSRQEAALGCDIRILLLAYAREDGWDCGCPVELIRDFGEEVPADA